MLPLSLQGVRVSETPEGISSLDPSRGESINVEPGCSWPDPCDSNPCPANSYCSNDWDSYSCSCDPGALRVLGNEAGVGAYTLSLRCNLESVASLSQHHLHFKGLAIWCSVWDVRKLGDGREASRGQGLNLSGPSCPRLLW